MADSNPTSNVSSSTLPRGLVSRRGGLVNPSARIPSLRPPRDLTLGGRPKKSFKPTIPVRKTQRDEPKDIGEPPSSSDSKGKEKRSFRDGSNRGRGRGRGRRQAETIQTHSIFEQGPMERIKGRGSSAPSYGGTGDASFTSKQIGAGSKKITFKSEEDYDKIAELLRDDFIDDSESKEDGRYKLVQLPLVGLLPKKEIKEKVEEEEMDSEIDDKGDKELKMEVDDFKDVKVKVEPVEKKEFIKPPAELEKVKKPKTGKIENTCASLFSGDRCKLDGELIFFQLPDTLPSFPMSQEEGEHKPIIKQEKDAARSLQQQQQKESQKESSQNCCLKDLPEGYLGKLQVMKSGKTRLMLSNLKLDVSMGSPCGFLQDLVSMKLGGEKGGKLITLGHVKHRIVCTPDFEQLLQLSST